jgi:hypothetical protein
VAHKSNPSYFGGRDQENLGLRSIWAKTYWDPTSTKQARHASVQLNLS